MVRRDAPTCRLTDRLDAARERASARGWDESIVVNDERIVLGRLRFDRIDAASETAVGQIMEPGPTTIRPNEPLARLAPRLREKQVARIVVTTPDGRLVGVVERRDAADRLTANSAR